MVSALGKNLLKATLDPSLALSRLPAAATVRDNSSGQDVENKPVGAEQEACERMDEVELLGWKERPTPQPSQE